MHRLVLAGLLFSPAALSAQSAPAVPLTAPAAAPRAERGLYLTVFRSPASGLELRTGRLSVHAGYYPTILRADGETKGKNTNFIRAGTTIYSSASGRALFLTPSLVFSLDDRWKNGALTEVGVRWPVGAGASLRLGGGILTTFGGPVRVNPTVGLDWKIGGRR